MNQKFINQVEKTEKKTPIYETPKSKRFARKRSQQSDRSIDSKKSNKTSLEPNIKIDSIQNVELKNGKLQIKTNDFFEHLANSVLISKQIVTSRPRYARGRTDLVNVQPIQTQTITSGSSGKNFDYRYQALTAQLEVRNKQLQVMGSECQLLKQSIKSEQQKRKQLQREKKQISSQLADKTKQLQKIQIQNKKLVKEKQYLVKQIQFLEKINYDDKTRIAQSYREKYLAKQLEEMRKHISMNKSELEKHLELQIKRIADEKYSIQTLYKALKVEKETLLKQIEKLRLVDRTSIFHSEEYIKLREKYKLCLDAYKKLKMQYVEVQRQLNRSLRNLPSHLINSSSSLSIVLSSSSSQKSNTSIGRDKEIVKMKKSDLYIEATTDKTPMKKSLSPRNRDQKSELDFKKPISPVSNKKLYQNCLPVSDRSGAQESLRQLQKKPQKKITFFNDEYKMKIGLSKNTQK